MQTAAKQRYSVAASSELADRGRLVVDVNHGAGNLTVGIFRVNGKLYAYENTCPHQGGPVCQGMITPGVTEVLDQDLVSIGNDFDEADLRIVCPWHGYEFRIETGSHPAKAAIRLNPIEVGEQDGEIYLLV